MGKLSDAQKIEMVEKYSTGLYSCVDLGKLYGVVPSAISNLLKRRKIKRFPSNKWNRKYTINEHYFDKIDTEDKAYFLGLLYADGYNNHKKGEIAITLQEKDLHILEDMKRFMESQHPIRFIKKPNEQCQNYRLFTVTSRLLSNALNKLGCHQKKSLTLKFPTEEQVPKYLHRHFIRGYFDGDGCISKHVVKKNGYIMNSICIVSTLSFCEDMKRVIQDNTSIPTILIDKRFPKSTTTTRNLRFSGSNNVSAFLEWLYKDTELFLKRKETVFRECMAENRSRKKLIEAFGEKKTMSEWSRDERCNVELGHLNKRKRCGWSIEEAITTPIDLRYSRKQNA